MAKQGRKSRPRRSPSPGKASQDSSASTSALRAPDGEARRRRIAEVAYRRAEARGFQGGDPVDDWLTAEAEVDAASRQASGAAP